MDTKRCHTPPKRQKMLNRSALGHNLRTLSSSMLTITPPPMQQMPLPKVAPITRHMRLPIQPLSLFGNRTHPPHLLPLNIQHLKLLPLILQLLRDRLNINPQIIPQKRTNLRVLMVPRQRARRLPITRVDIHVSSGVPVRTPPGLAAARDHVCVRVERDFGVVEEGGDFRVGVVFDAEAGGDGVLDEGGFCGEGGVVGEVLCVFEGEAFGGVGGVGEGTGVPEVLWVGGVEFYRKDQ
jgi:hypothetical protein